jgi:hypothetical protein
MTKKRKNNRANSQKKSTRRKQESSDSVSLSLEKEKKSNSLMSGRFTTQQNFQAEELIQGKIANLKQQTRGEDKQHNLSEEDEKNKNISYYKEKLEMILKAQEKEIRFNDSFATEVKEHLIKEMPSAFYDKLMNILSRNEKKTRLEIEKEIAEENARKFSVVLTAVNIPIKACNKEKKQEDHKLKEINYDKIYPEIEKEKFP